jgi:hypothetical protein
MTAEELYEKEFGDAESIPKESVIRLMKHFGKALHQIQCDMDLSFEELRKQLNDHLKKHDNE